jgi:PKD repeat protein
VAGRAAHRAQNADLLNAPAPGSTLCLRCHSGAGSPFDVAAQLNGHPANDASTDAYFRHLVEDGSARQVSCADCHNPHDANGTRPAMSTTGWTASGDIRGADGVAVTNGAAGSGPIYSPISRSNGGSLTLEYQLCLKCHSGATTLRAADAAHPSWWALDKGVELNPANASYHPIEAAGRNRSTQMAASLAGTSPFKAWDYTIESTVRCTSCHGDPSTVDQTGTATPKRPDADGREASHGSDNRGILIAPYRDRILKGAGEAYDPNDFGLCYLCHAEAPFADPNYDPSSPSTAFSLHGLHVANLPSVAGGGTSIDHRGDGAGLAICAECHFRIHSTAIAYKPGDIAAVARSTGATGLVNFAPNVIGPVSTGPVWTAPGSTGIGSCTLTCHGFTHTASSFFTYATAPGTGFSASLTTGPVGPSGLTIQFTDATRYVSAAGATWAWDFGDGATSTQQSPLHVYLSPGTYSVTLTVTRTSDGLSATMSRPAYITVVP